MLSNESQKQTKKETVCQKSKQWSAVGYATAPVDLYAERVCLACQSSCFQKQETNQRLDEQAKKRQGTSVGFIFDR